jgi:hypothetical protein
LYICITTFHLFSCQCVEPQRRSEHFSEIARQYDRIGDSLFNLPSHSFGVFGICSFTWDIQIWRSIFDCLCYHRGIICKCQILLLLRSRLWHLLLWHISSRSCAGQEGIIRIILCWVSFPQLPMWCQQLFWCWYLKSRHRIDRVEKTFSCKLNSIPRCAAEKNNDDIAPA